jgi:hypothetical protein
VIHKYTVKGFVLIFLPRQDYSSAAILVHFHYHNETLKTGKLYKEERFWLMAMEIQGQGAHFVMAFLVAVLGWHRAPHGERQRMIMCAHVCVSLLASFPLLITPLDDEGSILTT